MEQKKPDLASSFPTPTKTHHILMVAISLQGHINPLLRLGMLLQSKGLQVTLASTRFTHQRLLKRLAATGTTAPAPNSDCISISGIHFEFFADGTNLADDKENNLDEYMFTLEKFGPGNLSKLIRDLETREESPKKFSCIINNTFVPWVADVAEEHGIPCAMLWIQPCALLSIYYSFYNDLHHFPSSLDDQIDHTVDIPGLPLLKKEDLPSFLLPSNTFGCLQNILSKCLRNTHKIKWVLVNSFYELESEVIDAIFPHIPIKTVGPLVPPSLLLTEEGDDQVYESKSFDLWKADEDCLHWLDNMPPRSVIYISIGSIAVLPKESMESIAIALKNSNIPFVWVVKPSDVLDSEGSNQVPDWFMEEISREQLQGRLVSWCPQTQVLSHPSLGCFLTHCGWNSILESVCAGVPLICYPLWTDQPTNAKFVIEILEMGMRLWPDKETTMVDSKEIENCIEEIMVGPNATRLREKAAAWKRAAREAAARGGSSDRNIQWLVDEIIKVSV